MTLKTAKLLFVATVVLVALTAGATATTADANADAQQIPEDVTQSIDVVPHNDDICQMSGASAMCGGGGDKDQCPYPGAYYC